jgi:KaiC/GvpD/RAD55 family RecA-like ATPase
LVFSLASAITTILLGIALIIEGPALIAPTAMMLAPSIGNTQPIQISPGGDAYLSQHLNAGDRFLSDIIIQGGKGIGLRIEDPNGVMLRNESLGQEYALDFRSSQSGIYTIHLTSSSNVTSYVLTRTVIVRSLFGFDATTIVGIVLVLSALPVAMRSMGSRGVGGRRGFIRPERFPRQVPVNQTVLVGAPVCDEYETLVTSFLADSLKEGKSVFYVSLNSSRVEELYKKYPDHFFALICDSKAAAALQGLGNLEVSPGVADLTGLDITASKLLAKIGNGTATVAYLDIISDVLLRHSVPLARKWLTQMLAKLKGKGLTVLAGVNPAMVPSESVAGVIDLFDGYSEMEEVQEKRHVRRYLKWVRRPHVSRK